MIILVVLGFVFHSTLGVDSCIIALASATIMLLIGGQETEEIVLGVEWSTILFFTGLFVVVGGMVQTGVITALGNASVTVTDRQRYAADDPDPMGVGIVFVVSGQYSICRDDDPPDPLHAGGRNGRNGALVGAVAGRLPRRQRHADWRVGKCLSFRAFRQSMATRLRLQAT